MNRPLSPAKLGLLGNWYRLRRTDDGILCLESQRDDVLLKDADAEWGFVGEAPLHVAERLDDTNPDDVARVLSIVMRALETI